MCKEQIVCVWVRCDKKWVRGRLGRSSIECLLDIQRKAGMDVDVIKGDLGESSHGLVYKFWAQLGLLVSTEFL